jgi:MFS superfamily sulfate permease-like transporter
MAGLTIWALMVPQAMAYAAIAGVPVQNGLYVMPLAVVGYALLGSSRHLFVGPSATVATLSASSVAVVATASTGSAEYIALTCSLTLMVGAIYIVGGLARMGFVARFFARPVLEGFILGLGLYIAIGQLPAVVGIDKPSGNTLSVLANTIADVGSWEWTTVGVGVAGLVALFALARFAPKLPGVIIVVVRAELTRVLGGAWRASRRGPHQHPSGRRDRRRPQLHPPDPHDRPPAHRLARAQQRRRSLQ